MLLTDEKLWWCLVPEEEMLTRKCLTFKQQKLQPTEIASFLHSSITVHAGRGPMAVCKICNWWIQEERRVGYHPPAVTGSNKQSTYNELMDRMVTLQALIHELKLFPTKQMSAWKVQRLF